jgi:hypothetical protein
VGAVYLTNAARVERYYFDSSALDCGKVEEELLRGMEQSGDTFMPGVCVVKRRGLQPLSHRFRAQGSRVQALAGFRV